MKKGIPVIMEMNGKVDTIFPTLHDAARTLEKHVSSIKRRISIGSVVKGMRLRYMTQEETDRIRLLIIDMLNKDLEKTENPKLEESPKKKTKKTKKVSIIEEEDAELDGNKYTILSYELISDRVCVTPCPYKDAPKPKVGSALCMACGSFHGRNRSKKQVACSAVAWKPWLRKKAGVEEAPSAD